MAKFLKLFRRKKSTAASGSDPAAAGILSASASAQSSAAPQQKQKKEKKLSKRQLKKQKKKDKLAHFPTSGGGGGGGDGLNNLNNDGTPAAPGWEYNSAALEDQKENNGPGAAGSLASAPRPGTGAARNANNAVSAQSQQQAHQQYQSDFLNNDVIYDKPALSMIVEEKSPRNGQVISPTGAASGWIFGNGNGNGGRGGVIGPVNNGNANANGGFVGHPVNANGLRVLHVTGDLANGVNGTGSNGAPQFSSGIDPPQAQAQPPMNSIMSPMSGNKPPLTPNRLGSHRTSTGSSPSQGGASINGNNPPNSINLTPSQFRSPAMSNRHSPSKNGGLNGMTIDTELHHNMSPEDQSLRGMRLGSEEMCLSADDEDDEYNRMKDTGGAPSGIDGKEKFVSALDRSPFSYASEEDGNALFPALVEDKDPWQQKVMHGATSNTGATSTKSTTSSNKSTPKGELNILPMAHETQEDIRAWTPSPTKKSTFTFQGDKSSSLPQIPSMNLPSSTHNGRDKQHSSGSNGQKHHVLFDNFADFEPFDPSNSARFPTKANGAGHSSSKSVAHHGSSPVSALLEDSRARRKSGHRSIEGMSNSLPMRSGGGSSINSAPVLTPSHMFRGPGSAKNGSSSISRVIDNLELHVNKRQAAAAGHNSVTNSSVHSSSQHSHSKSDAGASAIREAKERIKRENMMNNESKMIDMLAAGGPSAAAAAERANAANAVSAGNSAGTPTNKDGWLFDEVTGTLGPRSQAADLESLGGRSNRSGKSRNSLGGKSHRSGRSHRSHRSKKSRSGNGGGGGGHRRHRSKHLDDGVSVDSRTSRNSRNSYRSYQTTKSMVSQMSEQSRSVANDLLRLEAQLSMVGKTRNGGSASVSGDRAHVVGGVPGNISGGASDGGNPMGSGTSVVSRSDRHKRRDDCGMTVTSRDYSISRSSAGGIPRRHHGKSSSSVTSASGRSRSGRDHISASARRAAARTLRSKVTVIAPPGKLGIILANRTDSRGTVVSGVRTSSVLAEQVSPGDRIIAIDEEDVSQMNVKEITTIMARKSEFERVLVLLAAPKVQYD